MKLKLIALFILIPVLGFAQEKKFSVGSPLPLGDRAIPYALSKVKSMHITADDESGRDHWMGAKDISGFESMAHFRESVAEFRPALNQIDPRDRINVEGSCFSEDGTILLSAYTSVKMEKTYNSSGQPFWGFPENGYLHFYLENLPIAFDENIEGAWFEWGNGNSTWISTDGNVVYMPGWMVWQEKAFLHLIYRNGQDIVYDGKTGQALHPHSGSFALESGVGGMQEVTLNENMDSYVTSYPEWNNVVNYEVTASKSGVANIQIRSYYGFHPLAVWMNTMTDLSKDENWEYIQPDENGFIHLEVTEGESFILWPEFPPTVYDMGDSVKG